jgi:hypothetical protein
MFRLLNDLVGIGEQAGWNFETERLGSLYVDRHVELYRQLNGEFSRLRAPQYAIDIWGYATVQVSLIGAVGNQKTLSGEERGLIHRRDLVQAGQRND